MEIKYRDMLYIDYQFTSRVFHFIEIESFQQDEKNPSNYIISCIIGHQYNEVDAIFIKGKSIPLEVHFFHNSEEEDHDGIKHQGARIYRFEDYVVNKYEVLRDSRMFGYTAVKLCLSGLIKSKFLAFSCGSPDEKRINQVLWDNWHHKVIEATNEAKNAFYRNNNIK